MGQVHDMDVPWERYAKAALTAAEKARTDALLEAKRLTDELMPEARTQPKCADPKCRVPDEFHIAQPEIGQHGSGPTHSDPIPDEAVEAAWEAGQTMSEWTDSDGNSLGAWVKTDRDEFRSLFSGEMVPFSTLTDPDGNYGPRQVYTAWGYPGEDAPRIDIRDYRDEDGYTTRQVFRKFVPAIGETDDE
jgi:hypothetical protein